MSDRDEIIVTVPVEQAAPMHEARQAHQHRLMQARELIREHERKHDDDKSLGEHRQEDADAAAQYVHRFMFHEHWGVLDLDNQYYIVVFGNNDYGNDERTRKQVEIIRRRLEESEWDTSFGVSKDGYSWAVIVYNHERRPVSMNDMAIMVRQAREIAFNCKPKR